MLVRPEIAARMRQHFEGDPSVVVFDASDTVPPVGAVAAKAQTLLIIGPVFADIPAGLEFLDRFREVNATAEIRILVDDPNGLPTLLRQAITHPAHLGLRAASQPLMRIPGRRAARVQMPASTEMLVNGVPVVLVDLSPLGAQVISSHVLKPGEHVHVRISGTPRVTATVVWSVFELSREGRHDQYRAGLEFTSRRR
jgi:hypothetical protein